MSLRNETIHYLEHQAFEIRLNSLLMTSMAGSGHLSSCLSAADIVAALFFYAMRFDPHNFDNPNNDRFILSKGHAAPLLYCAWAELGLVTQEELMTYRKVDSPLEGHPTRRFHYTEAATGALGIGLSIGAGMALAAKLDHRDYRTYILMGDGEIAEGCVWEAAEIADHYKLNNLIGIVDDNRLGQSTESLHAHHTQRYAEQFAAFGWHTMVINGHDMQEIMTTFNKIHSYTGDQPIMIIAKTYKGHGINLIENKEGWHGKALPKDKVNLAIEQLEHHYPRALRFDTKKYCWKPNVPKAETYTPPACSVSTLKEPLYAQGDKIATRKAYGQALRALGSVCKDVVSLDAEVKNSTFAEIFEEKFPDRFFQCYIAEQNMVSMGVGFDRRGKIPFISTFGAFFMRAHDQIRMAAISNAHLRLVGSHVGVSIGQDGPSQMALEDIAMMCALPDSIVLYPCDGVSTHALVGLMAEYDKGISYMRTTRMETAVIYATNESFTIGGCKVLRESKNDSACIVGAGVTLFEALKAAEQLQAEGIAVSVIDLYSIKPLDAATLRKVGLASGKRIITVEDHYLQGGLGQEVVYALRNSGITIECLAVNQLPRSGKPEELMALVGIDAHAIIKMVKK